VLIIELQQRFGERRELEEVVFFGQFLIRLSSFRIDVAWLCVVDKRFADYCVKPGVCAFVDVAVLFAGLE